MNWDLILLFLFAILLGILILLNKKKINVEKIAFPLIYILMYRTKLGLKQMDKLAKKFPKTISVLAYFGIIAGYASMILIFALLTLKVFEFLFAGSPSPIAPLLPGIKTVPGVPVLGFWHWIISIFILAAVHEFSHGLVARLHDVKLKSSGFAILSIILPIIPAAFVEPDEEQLKKRSNKQQLGVLAAGSFSNYLTAAASLIIFLFVLVPLLSATITSTGVVVAGVQDGYPASISGMKAGEQVISVNGEKVNNLDDFLNSLKDVKARDNVIVETNVSVYSITTVKSPESFRDKIFFWRENDKGYLGVVPIPVESDYKPGMEILGKSIAWVGLLFYWLFTINLAVGMFNMLPLGPVDGGRMFLIAANYFIKDEKTAKRVWSFVSLFCFALILAGLMPYIIKLFGFIFTPLIKIFF